MSSSRREIARRFAETARAAFEEAAGTFAGLKDKEWDGPTGCTRWDMRTLAGHIVGEAVWFPNIVRGITLGEKPYPSQLYQDLKLLPPADLSNRLTEAAREIEESVGEANDQQLEEPADMGWTRMPLWQATYVSAMEGVLHEWDTRARREVNPAIRREWATVIAGSLTEYGPLLAHHNALSESEGIYQALVDEPIGPVTIEVQGSGVVMRSGEVEQADLTVRLTADQYVRLITGRLGADAVRVPAEGRRKAMESLTRVFAGIANG